MASFCGAVYQALYQLLCWLEKLKKEEDLVDESRIANLKPSDPHQNMKEQHIKPNLLSLVVACEKEGLLSSRATL